MNRALLIACAVSAFAALAARLLHLQTGPEMMNIYAGFDLFTAALAVLLAALCSLALYGNFRKEEI